MEKNTKYEHDKKSRKQLIALLQEGNYKNGSACLLVYDTLLSYRNINDDGTYNEVYPAINTIADNSLISINTARSAIDVLEKIGYITRIKGDKLKQTSKYYFPKENDDEHDDNIDNNLENDKTITDNQSTQYHIPVQTKTWDKILSMKTNKLGIDPDTALAVYSALKRFYDNNNKNICISYDKIATMIQKSKRSVMRAVKILINNGFIIKTNQTNTRTNCYYFPTEEIEGYWELVDNKCLCSQKRIDIIKNSINLFGDILYNNNNIKAFEQYKQTFLATCLQKKQIITNKQAF